MISEETLKDILQAFADSGNEPDKKTLNELAAGSEKSLQEIIRFYDEARVQSSENEPPLGFRI